MISKITFTLKNQDFYYYYENNINPDIDRLGAWKFKKKYNISSVTTNQAESVNAMVARFSGVKGGRLLSIDFAALTMYSLLASFDRQIIRGRYRVGEKWTLLKKLEKKYKMKHFPIIQDHISQEKILEDLLKSNIEVKESVRIAMK